MTQYSDTYYPSAIKALCPAIKKGAEIVSSVHSSQPREGIKTRNTNIIVVYIFGIIIIIIISDILSAKRDQNLDYY